MKTALADHQELARRGHLSGHMRRTGALHIFDSDNSFRGAGAEWKERARHGVDYREVTVDRGPRQMAPALTGPFARAIFAPENWTVSSPNGILQGLRGGSAAAERLQTAGVKAVRPGTEGIVVDHRRRHANALRCGGHRRRRLVARTRQGLGLGLVLEAERGYNTTWATPPIALDLPVFFDDHGFCATPLDDGLRVGGAVEIAAIDAPPTFARAAAMRKKMRRYVPGSPTRAARNGWAAARRRRIRCPSSAPTRRTRASSSPSATAISA